MIFTNVLKTRFERRNKLFALLVVFALEASFASYLWVQAKPKAILGFLAKNGNHYVLAWKDATGYETNSYASLKDALKFAQDELRLNTGRNPLSEHELEHVWLQDRFGAYMLLWKTTGFNFLNQITFQSHDDAVFFAKAFRAGGYSPSPVGHSVLLMPIRSN